MSNIAKGKTVDSDTGEVKETLFRAYFNHNERRGEFSRSTKHQTHGLFFRLVDKPDPALGTKKAILVTVYERAEYSNSIYPDMAVTLDLCDLVHKLLGVEEKKVLTPEIIRFEQPDEMNTGLRLPEEVILRAEEIGDRYGNESLEEYLINRVTEAIEEFATTKGRERVETERSNRIGGVDPDAGPGALDQFYPEGA